MLCCKCGKETGTDSEVCRFCGESLPNAGILDRNQLERAVAAGTRRIRKRFILIGVIAIALRALAAVSGGPSADEICVQNGEAYLKQGMYDKALAEFDKAVTINPIKTEAYLERARIYELKKDYDKAIGIENAPLTSGRSLFFSKRLPKPKICEVIVYEKENRRDIGGDPRGSFPNRLKNR